MTDVEIAFLALIVGATLVFAAMLAYRSFSDG